MVTFMLLSILSFFKHAPQLGTCLRAVSSNTVGFTVVRKRSREDHDKAPISNYPGIELKAASIRILHLSPSSDKQRQRSCRSWSIVRLDLENWIRMMNIAWRDQKSKSYLRDSNLKRNPYRRLSILGLGITKTSSLKFFSLSNLSQAVQRKRASGASQNAKMALTNVIGYTANLKIFNESLSPLRQVMHTFSCSVCQKALNQKWTSRHLYAFNRVGLIFVRNLAMSITLPCSAHSRGP